MKPCQNIPMNILELLADDPELELLLAQKAMLSHNSDGVLAHFLILESSLQKQLFLLFYLFFIK
jgi:hypothetical protein